MNSHTGRGLDRLSRPSPEEEDGIRDSPAGGAPVKGGVRTVFTGIVVPSFLIGYLVLHLFWLLPARILSQEYVLADWFLTRNAFVLAALGASAVCAVLLALGHRFCRPVHGATLGLVLFLTIVTTAYPWILPYDYGGFVDNHTLTPEHSFLGFSKAYYLLDFVLLAGIPFLVWRLVRTRTAHWAVAFLSFFYLAEGVQAFLGLRISPHQEKTLTLSLSTNHPNVLMIIYDSVPPGIAREYLTNRLPPEHRAWTKDFTFFDNYLYCGAGMRTGGALPMILGGKEFSEQKQWGVLRRKVPPARRIPGNVNMGPRYFFSELAMLAFMQRAGGAQVSFRELPALQGDGPDGQARLAALDPSAVFQRGSPIVFVPLYDRTPYFLRKLLVRDHAWRWAVRTRWISGPTRLVLATTETTAAQCEMFYNQGLHGPHENPLCAVTMETATTSDEIHDLYMSQLRHNMASLEWILEAMKTAGVYDNTRIILLSDHGPLDSAKEDLAIPVFLRYANGGLREFYKHRSKYPREAEKRYTLLQQPAFLMVKDGQQRGAAMKTDSRFLASIDVQGIALGGLNPASGVPDYSATVPSERRFRIAICRREGYRQLLNDPGSASAYQHALAVTDDGKALVYEISSVKDGRWTSYRCPIEEIENMDVEVSLP